MPRRSFLHGAMLLTAAGFLSKVIGAIYLIPLTRLIGAEGVGLYQMAYPAYGIALVISASGIPIAISKVVAENLARGNARAAERVVKVSFVMLALLGSGLAATLFYGARFFAGRITGDIRATYPIMTLAPAVLVVSVMGAFRGYFQGQENMLPTALSQIIEQTVRVATGLSLAYILMPYGVGYAACGPTLGAFTGGLAGLIALLYIYMRRPATRGAARMGVSSGGVGPLKLACDVMGIAVPVTLASFATPLIDLLNAAIVPSRLQSIGYEVSQATQLYGYLEGMAMGLVGLPTVVTQAIGTSIVPSIAGAYARRNYREAGHRAQQGLRFSVLLGFPAFLGLAILARPISQMLFAAPEAGVPLAYLAVGSLFLCVQQTASGILQGLSRPFVPARNLLLGALLGGILNYVLTGTPGLGIKGAAIGTALGFACSGTLNVLSVRCAIKAPLGLGRPILTGFVGSLGMGALVILVYRHIFLAFSSNSLATLSAIAAGAAGYFLALLLLREIGTSDIEMVPVFGHSLALALGRMGLVRR